MEKQGSNGNNILVNVLEKKQRLSSITYQNPSPLQNGILREGVLGIHWSVEKQGANINNISVNVIENKLEISNITYQMVFVEQASIVWYPLLPQGNHHP